MQTFLAIGSLKTDQKLDYNNQTNSTHRNHKNWDAS